MRIAATAVAVVTLFATAHAEPTATDEKSPGVALGLSVAGTALPLAVVGAVLATDHPEDHIKLYSTAWIATLLGPSLGHWYAGDYLTPGLIGRGAGGLMVIVGLSMSLSCLGSVEPCETNVTGEVLGVSGIALMAGSAIYDIATAGRAARRWNLAHVQVAPTMIGTGASSTLGMGMTGTF